MKQLKITITLLFIATQIFAAGKDVVIQNNVADPSARILFGISKLEAALKANGYNIINKSQANAFNQTISISIDQQLRHEGFTVTNKGNRHVIIGADRSGVLYGCLQLIQQIKEEGSLPAQGSMTDAPQMPLRGECIGLQKSYYLPGRTVYEYPYTPQTFPWFYNKKLWIQVLDSMLANRMNSLYLWNGHPFASLVRLKDYPYAVEVDDATFKKNEEMYRLLTTEADKRGIWVIQMFYNIIVSKPFAEKNHLKTQDRNRPIIPLIADYTRKSIAAFVEKYPNVGLLVCLGEAMQGVGNDDIEWFTKTIIPGVKDGLKALGKKEEPPIVLRAHDTDAPSVMKEALPLYKNIYTMAKFNGEALTDPRPRGKWTQLHQTLSHLGSGLIENVHIMANLEPFRYGSPDFIQQSVKGMHDVMGGNGLHLYPQASYWDWPYTADSIKGGRLLQVERDWIWYKAWSRYAWNANRSKANEINYWSEVLGNKYGCSKDCGRKILQAYDESGEIAPKLLRRFGITDGNRQTLTLGMLMTQLINPQRYGLFTLLYDSESPEGEMLGQYAEREWKGEKHIGETPVQIIREVKEEGDKAVLSIDEAATKITKNKAEFERLKNDMYCYRALAYHYAEKASAALDVLRYKYSNDLADLEKALPKLERSVSYYKQLVSFTKGSYLYANSMQTKQRKIPLRAVNGSYKTWAEVLIPFEKELSNFKHNIDSLKQNSGLPQAKKGALKNANVRWVDSAGNYYVIDSAAKLFPDTSLQVMSYAHELNGLKGARLSFHSMEHSATSFTFTSATPVSVLVGYFNSQDTLFAKAPELETDASANDYGQADIKIANALVIKGMPPVNIHSYTFGAGTNTLHLPKGTCLVLGFVKGDQPIPVYDAGLTENGATKEVDWLFE